LKLLNEILVLVSSCWKWIPAESTYLELEPWVTRLTIE